MKNLEKRFIINLLIIQNLIKGHGVWVHNSRFYSQFKEGVYISDFSEELVPGLRSPGLGFLSQNSASFRPAIVRTRISFRFKKRVAVARAN